MAYVATTMMAFGVVLSALAGTCHYFGSGCLDGRFNWLPHLDLLQSNPTTALIAGGVIIVLSLAFQPSRVN